jgi:hypothetical protein
MLDKWAPLTLDLIHSSIDGLYKMYPGKNKLAHRLPLFNKRVSSFTDLMDKTSFNRSTRKSQGLSLNNSNQNLSMSVSPTKYGAGGNKKGELFRKLTGFFESGWKKSLALLDGSTFYVFEDGKGDSKLAFFLPSCEIGLQTDPEHSTCFRILDRKTKETYVFAGTNKYDTEEWIHLLNSFAHLKEDDFFLSLTSDIGNFIPAPSEIPGSKVKEAHDLVNSMHSNEFGLISVKNGVRLFGKADKSKKEELSKRKTKAKSSKALHSFVARAKANCKNRLKQGNLQNTWQGSARDCSSYISSSGKSLATLTSSLEDTASLCT